MNLDYGRPSYIIEGELNQNNQIIIPVYLNGNEIDALIDTGANEEYMDIGVAISLGSVFNGDAMVANLSFSEDKSGSLVLIHSNKRVYVGCGFDILIGMNLLKGCIITIEKDNTFTIEFN